MIGKTKKLSAFIVGLMTAISCSSGIIPDNTSQQADAAASRVLAFPGAVGGGKYSTGGRGGEVYHVTNLNDKGEGSFRDAVSQSHRIVVFDVSGTIELESAVSCAGNVTIAGQTAPGGAGITLKNYKMAFGGDNIICRYISSRPGPYKATSSGNDAWGGSKGSNSIVDHCSLGWASDEQWGLYSDNSNYTVQYSVIGPANSWGGHDKGIHGFAIMMGNSSLTYDHNLIIHNVSRNFRGKIPGTGVVDFTNNIIYDWGYQTAYGTIGHLNYVNNTLKAGNSTTSGYNWVNVDSTTKPQNFKIYCAGNQMINKDGSMNGITYNNWNGITVKDGIGITKDNLYTASPFTIDNNGENVSTASTCESAAASYNNVINYAGNGITPDKRTAIDQQCAYETKSGTGSCSGTAAYNSSVSDLNKYNIKCGVTYSYPAAVNTKTINDADNDGMDDNWELERGLDPSDPNDYNGDYCDQGYTNIEYYINDLTAGSFPDGVVKTSPTGSFQQTPPVSAFEIIEAESYFDQEGVQTEDTSGGGQNIGYIENGDWVMYKRVDFGNGAKSVKARLSGNPANIEVYTGSMTGTPVTTLSFKGTEGFSDYQEIEFNIPQIKGVQNLYLKFTGGEGYLLNADSFVFGEDAIPLSGELFKNVEVTEQAYPMTWAIVKNTGIGSKIFGDRDFAITLQPSALEKGEILQTACNAKGTSGDVATFTAGKDMTLYIGLDSRVEKEPEWLSDYTKIRSCVNAGDDLVFGLYQRSVKKGEKITLGSNGQTYMCVNYTVFAVPNENVPLIGDLNYDNAISIADAVTLINHLNGKTPLEGQAFRNADMNSNGKVNGYDLILLKRLIFK